MRLFLPCVLTAALVALTATAPASTVLTYSTSGFELPDISPDTVSITSPSGWSEVSNKGYFHVMFRDGTASEGEQYVEIRTPVDDDGGFDYGLLLDNTTPIVYQPGRLYRVSTDVRLGEVTPTSGRFTLRIETPIHQGRDLQIIPSFDVLTDIPDSDDWLTLKTDWFAPSADALGDNMRIQIQVGNLANAGSGIQFDNVFVEEMAVIPEPLTLAGLLLGGGCLGGYLKRRRGLPR